jgi:hypothetical protein
MQGSQNQMNDLKTILIILFSVLQSISVAAAQQTDIESIPKAVFILIDGVPADVANPVPTKRGGRSTLGGVRP